MTVTYANNYWKNTHSRGPSFRFGTGHVFNNYYDGVTDGINSKSFLPHCLPIFLTTHLARDGAQLLVESNAFTGSSKPLYSTDAGYAVCKSPLPYWLPIFLTTHLAVDNDFGGESNTALKGTLTTVPYSYTKLGSANVKAAVTSEAGATLSF